MGTMEPGGPVVYREFLPADYEAAAALWERAEGVEIAEGDSQAEIAAFLARNPGLSRVAEENGEMVGVALCGHDGRRGWIYHVAVRQEKRRTGVARRLVEEGLRGLRAAGITRALILVSRENESGRAFWRGSGWEEVEAALLMGVDL